MATVVVQCSMIAYAVQVGDVVGEDFEEIFSETGRMTVNDVEYLYTFKGIQNFKSIVKSVNGNGYSTFSKYEDVETQFVIEKAIPLTGNYNIVINVRELLNTGMSIGGSFYFNDSNGNVDYVLSNFCCTAASSIVIGDSCFEDNELIKTICIEADEVSRGLRIANRSFYGAKNFRYFTVMDVIEKYSSSTDDEPSEHFRNLTLKSIGESAFEGCTSLKVIGCDCSELKRIEANAFKECSDFLGLVSTFESLKMVGSWGDGDCYMSHYEITYNNGNCITNKRHYVWDTPKLEYIGGDAFNGAGTMDQHSTYDEEYGAERDEYIEWTFGKGDIEIGGGAFYNCGFLKKIYFPTTMERITYQMFYGLKGSKRYTPTQLYFPDSLISIDTQAFWESTVQVMKWPTSLQEIGNDAFSTSHRVVYEINQDQTAVKSSLMYNWIPGLPTTIETLGEGAFRGICTFGAMSEPVWTDGKIVDLKYSSSSIDFCGPLSGTIAYPTSLTSIPRWCFRANAMLEKIIIHGSVTNIGSYAFQGCSCLDLVIPSSVREVGIDVGVGDTVNYNRKTYSVSGVKSVVFEGKPPKGIVQSKLLDCSQVLVFAEYATEWAPYMNGNVKLAKKVNGEWVALGGKVISNTMRASDPTIMDIKYKVASTKDKVNVRILAYKDGVRSFANALPLATLVDGTEANVGDGVAANVEHTVSWQVSKDWDADLAKLSVEVFVMEDNLLPLQLTTIPANNGHPSVTFSRNSQSSEKVMNALYWLYADKTSGLTLEKGVLKSGGKQLVNGTSLSTENALSYIYSKMGYGTLSGDTLKYVNNLMRSSISSGKFAVKEGAAE